MGWVDFVSAEACLVDGDDDTVNGGCNSDAPFPFEAGVIGQSISGTVSTYVVAGDCPADITGDGTVNT